MGNGRGRGSFASHACVVQTLSAVKLSQKDGGNMPSLVAFQIMSLLVTQYLLALSKHL